MKRLRYLIPVLLGAALTSGCLKTTEAPPVLDPDGTFAGEFRLISKKSNKTTIDTVKANIKLSLSQATARYSVTGDTAVIHAGSKGRWGTTSQAIGFADSTLSAANAAKNAPIVNGKAHLHGTYLYVYNGSILQMKTVIGDSVAFEYDLKKVN
ncbi:hypothetical protein D0C36_06135 [Mucilaginibacter conchicola]|uniref:DUF306 domain-containing protein n=1 Tax=Mucilaginibacter conchicola TaxID=2303333 RepID=A0A372NYB7_9SPHI|nr:hypothetical protein [Mucilaginibacter conchicola]RFZ95103.1 hypothetical protein D0C36_06135 [Mucilaginibacter conchicola]